MVFLLDMFYGFATPARTRAAGRRLAPFSQFPRRW